MPEEKLEEKKDNTKWIQLIVSFIHKLTDTAYLWWIILYTIALTPLYFIAKWFQLNQTIKTEIWIGVLVSYLVITLSFVLPIMNMRGNKEE